MSQPPPIPPELPDPDDEIASDEVQQAPAVGKAPPAGKKFPCPSCGARLDFDPSSRALKCPYCGHAETIQPGNKEVAERDWESYLKNQAGEKVQLQDRSSEVKCNGCGAVVLLEDKVVTDKCPYCSRQLENKPQTAQQMIQPQGILPFAVTRRDVIQAFQEWLASRWFAPNALKRMSNLGQLAGAYMPFWTFDSMTYSAYRGMRGDNYTTTRMVNGKSQTVTKTRWSYVSGEIQEFFDDVLIYASQTLENDLVDELQPWDLSKGEHYQSEFLSGFQTERYTIGPEEGWQKARTIMDDHIRTLVRRDIGGDKQRINYVHTQHIGVTFKHILLPVWIASYRFQDRPFRILVNARTGEVVGKRPYSWIKITLLVVAILSLVGLAVWFFSQQ